MSVWDWLTAAHAIHVGLVVVAAIGFLHFWISTRFWLPRYAHYLGGLGLALGLGCLALMPPDAPINQGGWGGLKKALLVLTFPALVYFFFVFYGGQRAAYERTHLPRLVACPHCREADVLPGEPCPNCGQSTA
jgi:hypothetical protein